MSVLFRPRSSALEIVQPLTKVKALAMTAHFDRHHLLVHNKDGIRWDLNVLT